ncbi:ABC transporter ATP-binding protein [Lacticaseibacillus suibinensis]|uniref:ABC transporter ATP-binding protein n=1 Tax=Lacticaseibacillus suibinensis TaxID=2486011 RepID=UPI000F77F0B2|nr:ATP-binding cassette domain-containing protein [Lacticaseibacillus suibinensis]
MKLTVAGLTALRGDQLVLADLSFVVPDRGILAVLGPSGTGKTTLIDALTRQLPSTGDCRLDDAPIDPRRQHLAVVPQDYGLLPWRTVAQNVALPLKVSQHHRLDAAQHQAVAQVMAALGIAELAKRYPNRLSGGQQQRVALARAFAQAPDLLMLDEAFSALDPVVKARAYQLFISQWQARPVTTLLITHDLEEALALGDALLILHHGQGQVQANPLAKVPLATRREDARYYPAVAALRQEVEASWQE